MFGDYNVNSTETFVQKIKDNLFTCPKCKLGSLISDPQKEIYTCSQCHDQYPIIKGIPRLVDQQNYSLSFGYQWNIHRKTQLDSHTQKPISKNRLYKVTQWEGKDLSNQTVLEAGSGAGRFTEVLVKTNAQIYSFDYSEAVDANAMNNGEAKNLTLFQGDIFNIPFKKNFFDHVFCLGVIQHTPDPKLAFLSLASHVKPGGYLYIDIYTKSWHHLLQWKYLLRPITMNMKKETLYRIISFITPLLLPLTQFLKKYLGRFGARLMPIVEYSQLNLSPKLNLEWAILDTFDMYSPAHDHPGTMNDIKKWFKIAGFTDVNVEYGDNGVIGRGKKPTTI